MLFPGKLLADRASAGRTGANFEDAVFESDMVDLE
jgi:hypothetical protein